MLWLDVATQHHCDTKLATWSAAPTISRFVPLPFRPVYQEVGDKGRRPRVKLLRKGAAGLNASSEGEIRMYGD